MTDEVEVKLEEWKPNTNQDKKYDFTTMDALGAEWLSLRNATEKQFEFVNGDGLYLYGNEHSLNETANTTYIGIRQCHHQCKVEATVTFDELMEQDVVGLAVLQSNEYHAKIELQKEGKSGFAKVLLCQKGQDEEVGAVSFPLEESIQQITLTAEIAHLKLRGSIAYGNETIEIAKDVPIHTLSTEVAGGFVGETIGVYTISKQNSGKSKICVKRMTYQALEGGNN